MRVWQLLTDARHQHWMSVVNLGEVYYRVGKEEGLSAARRALESLAQYPIQIVDADRPMTLAAARIKALHAISFADCFAAALARDRSASVITGDKEFEELEERGLVTVEWLPPKPKSRRR
jgi:ribonuclease VapC